MTTRRDLFKLGALAAAAAALPSFASAASEGKPVGKAAKPLNILILGGTGFTGPFQVEYALARGHQVTTFNRGRRPIAEWGDRVEQLVGLCDVAVPVGQDGAAAGGVDGHAATSKSWPVGLLASCFFSAFFMAHCSA